MQATSSRDRRVGLTPLHRHRLPRPRPPDNRDRPAPAAPPAGGFRPDPKWRDEVRAWRLSTPMSHFEGVKKQFADAGIKIQAYNLSFNESFTDEEIDRGFLMAKALGADFITASATLKSAQRVAPFADKHQYRVAMHNHANIKDPNEFATPESFAAALAMSKYFVINLDIGHFTAANYDAVPYIEQHHARIVSLHLKDRKRDQGANLPWGEGDTPIKPVLQLLKTKGYDIPANIEYQVQGRGYGGGSEEVLRIREGGVGVAAFDRRSGDQEIRHSTGLLPPVAIH